MPRPYTPEELAQAGERPEHEREPLPQLGEHVLFRRYDWDTTQPGVITDVQDMTTYNDGHGGSDPDYNVWYPPGHERAGELRDDPWPWVSIQLDGGGDARTKEARLEGSPGWLRPGSRWDVKD